VHSENWPKILPQEQISNTLYITLYLLSSMGHSWSLRRDLFAPTIGSMYRNRIVTSATRNNTINNSTTYYIFNSVIEKQYPERILLFLAVPHLMNFH
jgi:hypothetical protein